MPSDYTATGPVFDGRARQAAEDFARGVSKEIADQGVLAVKTQLNRVLQHPTGYYRSRITTDRAAGGGYRVTDSNTVYGPWLEGVSSRNRTSRFKGYHTFRLVRQQFKSRVGAIADRTFQTYLRRMR